MALTDIEAVRAKTSDQPVLSSRSWTTDGEKDEFALGVGDIIPSPAPRVWLAGTLLVEDTDYTINYLHGVLVLNAVPSADQTLRIEYTAVVYTDEEVQHFLDEAGGNTTLAAATNLWYWAVSAAKMAKKETLSGGGAAGLVTVDTAVRARELRESAKALFDLYQRTEGEGTIAESITEIAWTPMQAERMVAARILRELD